MTRQLVCRTADVPANGMKRCVGDGGLEVLVANSGDDYFAYQAICPHQDVDLCDGIYDGAVLTCHQHLWQWDIRTGNAMGLAEAPLEYYEVDVDDGNVYVVPPNALKMAELFSGVPEATLKKLIAASTTERHEAGTTLYNVGDPASDVYVLERGRVNFVIGRDGRTTPDGFALRKGEVFGWNALLEGYPQRIAAATCLEDSAVVRIDGRQMLQILESDPAAGYIVMRRLASLINRYVKASNTK